MVARLGCLPPRRAALARPSFRVAARSRWVSGWLALALAAGCACAQQSYPAQAPAEYVAAGERALDWTRWFVDRGPRPAGSTALAAQFGMIVGALRELRCEIETDEFVAETPVGALPMRNVIARFGPPDAAEVVVVSGHYDTLRKEGFLGANDGGSSAGLLLALAERLHAAPLGAVWLVFFDGEEATVAWRNNDHTYGSRRVAQRWAADRTAARIRALINVDMIGDRDLNLIYEGNSDARLRQTIWSIAGELGYAQAFGNRAGYIADDHIPFVKIGVPSVNLIDFEFGPRNSYWHTLADTVDKLDARSFATILHVLETAIPRILAD